MNNNALPLLANLRTPKEVFFSLRNFLAGQHLGATRDDALLDELLKCLFCKLYIETSTTYSLPPAIDDDDLRDYIKKEFFEVVRDDFSDFYDKNTEILLAPNAIRVIFNECNFSLLDAGTDPIGDAFEAFVGSDSEGHVGQFFTPRVVTEFLVNALNPKLEESVIDPACGAGGFLASVVRRFSGQGLSVEQLTSYASEKLFGVDKDTYLAKLAKLHISLLTKGSPTILCGDTIALLNGQSSLSNYFPDDGFDVLFANPPFGTKIVSASPQVLKTFTLARNGLQTELRSQLRPTAELHQKVPPKVLFIERCFSLLKNGGRLGIVLPESVLSNKSYRHVVQYIWGQSAVRQR